MSLCWDIWHVTKGEELCEAAELTVEEMWTRVGAQQLFACRCDFIYTFALSLTNPSSPSLLQFQEDEIFPAPLLPLAEPWLPLYLDGMTVSSVCSGEE